MRICNIDGCGKTHHANGFCKVHYTKDKRHRSRIDKFVSKVFVSEPERFKESIAQSFSATSSLKSSKPILAFGCIHLPFEHKHALDFIKHEIAYHDPEYVVITGDLIDNHSLNYHEHNPDGLSSGMEVGNTRDKLKEWYKALEGRQVIVTLGNHDALPFRKALTHGISSYFFKDYRDLWESPRQWVWQESVIINNVMFKHGTGTSGDHAHIKSAQNHMMSCVQSHLHTNFGVNYLANDEKLIFGAATGCLVDREAYAMAYGKTFHRKPILGAIIVHDNGRFATPLPMKLGHK